VEWWSGGVVEWWNGGMVEWWSGGVVEWWSVRSLSAYICVHLWFTSGLCDLCVFVVKFGLRLPFAVADFADDPEYGMVRLIFQGADKVGE
jgi:hypothetical protein